MLQKRTGVFETNSSSTHSVSISDSTDYESINHDGTIYLDHGEYGWEKEIYTGITNRLTYAATFVLSREHTYSENELKEFIENDKESIDLDLEKFGPNTTKLIDVLKEQTGAKNFKIYLGSSVWSPFGYIDHQSEDRVEKIFASEKSLKQFIFAKDSYFETDNDNG